MAALDQQGLLSRPTSSVLSASSAPFEANISGSADGALCSDGNTQFPADSSSSTDQPDGPESSDVSPSSRRKKLHLFASRTKEATKRLLNAPGRDDRPSGLPAEDDQPPYVLGDDAAFNLNKLDTEHRSDKGIKRKLQVNLQAVAAGIVHPKQAFKGKATRSTAGRLSKVERPYLSKDMDLDLLEAHDDLSRAQSTSSSARHTTEDDTDPGTDGLKDRVARLEAHRESLRAAYTTSRLVQRVRVVPKRHIKFPGDEYFVERNDQGERIRYDWLKWMGYCILYYAQDFSAQYIDDFDQLPFSRESLQQEIERLAMASAPWQAFFMDVRSVYRWESPLATTKWLAIYTYLWHTQHLVGFIYAYIIYIVLRHRYFPSSVESLRESIRRSHDQRGRAHKFSELIDKHGRNHWLEPFLDELGPYAQLQLHDMVNLLEVVSNFHAWVSPRKTTASLIFIGTCLLITLLADMAFCMKIVSFIIGGAFFCCWPIASRYPKYRYLVSPFKWALWDIPTDAEWAFRYLRRNAQATRERLIQREIERSYQKEKDNDQTMACNGRSEMIPNITVQSAESDEDDGWHSASSTIGVLDETDIIAYRAYSQGSVGRLVIYSGGIRFVRSLKRKDLWRRSFLDLAEMRKQDGSSVSKLPTLSSQSLELKFMDGSTMAIKGMRDRDSAFNTIIGFSGLQWQSLQAKTLKGVPSDGSPRSMVASPMQLAWHRHEAFQDPNVDDAESTTEQGIERFRSRYAWGG